MTTYADAFTELVRGTVCGLTAAPADAQERAFLYGSPGAGNPELRSRLNALQRLACGIPGLPAGSVPDIKPRVSGGQCPTAYSGTIVVTWEQSDSGPGTTQDGWSNTPGPLSLVFVAAARSYRVINGIGSVAAARSVPPNAVGVNVTVTPVRLDGQPDNCGNEENPPPVPTEYTFNTDITYGDQNQYTENYNVTLAPVYVGLDGTVRVPVRVSGNDLDLVGEVSLSPEVEGKFNPASTARGETVNVPQGDPPPDDVDGPIVGVTILSTIDSGTYEGTTIPQNVSPAIRFPRLANVSFKVAIEGVEFWTNEIPVRGTESIIPCPWPQGAVDVAVTFSKGASGLVFLVYKRAA